jgi:hypothetical protein
MSITSIQSLIVPNKTVEVEYPGMPGFKISLCFLSREVLATIRKKSSKTTFKNRQTQEELDEELFLKLYVENTIKGWSGLNLSYLSQLLPIDMSGQDVNTVVDYTHENALSLMKNSSNFDAFITEQVSDLGNFSKSK